jgi:hypothetical protein
MYQLGNKKDLLFYIALISGNGIIYIKNDVKAFLAAGFYKI